MEADNCQDPSSALCLPACSSALSLDLYPHCSPLPSICPTSLLPQRSSRVWIMPTLSDTSPPVFSHSWSVFQCFCTFNLHACFGKTSTPEKSTSGRAPPSMRWSILFLLQEWPIFWTLFSAAHFLQRFVLNSPEGDPHLFRWFTVPTQSQLENFHNTSCFWHWCYILVTNWCWSWSCNTLNTWHMKSWFIGKDPDAGKDWRQTTEDEMVGWHYRLSGRESDSEVAPYVWLFATPWTVVCQAPPSMGFPRQEDWSGLPFPSPGDLPNPGIKPGSPTLQVDSLLSETPVDMSLSKLQEIVKDREGVTKSQTQLSDGTTTNCVPSPSPIPIRNNCPSYVPSFGPSTLTSSIL